MVNKKAIFSAKGLFTFFAMVGFGLILGLGAAQEKTIKKAPIKYTDPGSAKEMYTEYCAVCHGAEGKGNGPAASEFKTPPTDLTMLAKNNNGKYPDARVYSTLKFGTNAPAHGTLEMPIWIDLFRSMDPNTVELRMSNLVEYIQKIQAK